MAFTDWMVAAPFFRATLEGAADTCSGVACCSDKFRRIVSVNEQWAVIRVSHFPLTCFAVEFTYRAVGLGPLVVPGRGDWVVRRTVLSLGKALLESFHKTTCVDISFR